MSSSMMSLKQAERWVNSLKNPGPYGWKAEHNKFGAYFKREFKKRAKKHVAPNGMPWAKGFSEPNAKIGETASMILTKGEGNDRPKSVNRGGSVVVNRIKTTKGKKANRRFKKMFGPPAKPDKWPLIKTSGVKIKKKRRILDYLSKTGRSIRTSKTSFFYGYSPGQKWIEKLHNGGTYLGHRVPARPILGVTHRDILFVEKTYLDGYEKRRLKGRI